MNDVTNKENTRTESFRFEIYKGKLASDGSFVKTRVAGHAYLSSGKHAYKVKLFTLTQDRFVIVPGEASSDHYKILTMDEVQTKDRGKRTYWNVVGDAEILSQANVIKLKFDLFGEPLFMSLFPSGGGSVIPLEPFNKLRVA